MKKVLLLICMLSMGSLAWAQSAPPLASSQSFAVLGASTVTNTGPSIITGDLGVSPGTSCTGFPAPCTGGPGVVTGGTIHAGDATATAAQADAHTAYAALVAEPCGTNLTGQILGTSPGAVTLTPGVYCFPSTSAQLTGTLTLNGNGVYVFQIGSTLTTASNSSVVLANGATAGNVFWQVGSSSTLGTNTVFVGSVLALISDTVTTGTSVNGRVFALTGAVTLDSNAITAAAAGTGGGGGGGGHCDDNSEKIEAKFEDVEMESENVTVHLDKGPHEERLEGDARINGHAGKFQLDISDDGRFSLRLSNGFSVSGQLKDNEQIKMNHKRCHNDDDDRNDKDHKNHKNHKDKDEDHKD